MLAYKTTAVIVSLVLVVSLTAHADAGRRCRMRWRCDSTFLPHSYQPACAGSCGGGPMGQGRSAFGPYDGIECSLHYACVVCQGGVWVAAAQGDCQACIKTEFVGTACQGHRKDDIVDFLKRGKDGQGKHFWIGGNITDYDGRLPTNHMNQEIKAWMIKGSDGNWHRATLSDPGERWLRNLKDDGQSHK